MTASNFDASLGLTLVYEGGWSDNPKDPGGATMRGITQAVYNADRRDRRLPIQSVRLITDAELRAIYRSRYWDLVQASALPIGVDYAVFDFAVNSGVSRASGVLQDVVGVKRDGNIGLVTLGALSSFVSARGAPALIDAICCARLDFLRGLSSFATFGAGWSRRVMGAQPGHQVGDTGVIDRAYAMTLGGVIANPLNVTTTVKSYNATAGVASTDRGKGASE